MVMTGRTLNVTGRSGEGDGGRDGVSTQACNKFGVAAYQKAAGSTRREHVLGEGKALRADKTAPHTQTFHARRTAQRLPSLRESSALYALPPSSCTTPSRRVPPPQACRLDLHYY